MTKEQSKVLIIYTGGTIGMIKDSESGALKPFDFAQLEKHIPEIGLLACQVDATSIANPIDSSNMNIAEWMEMATIIKDSYDIYDGFVILHGSDTMAFTGAALSFMLQSLAKPVILTGSQLPIGVVRTDGKENIITALEIASDYSNGNPVVPEVAIYFEYHLYRANRTYKFNAEHFEAFRSPNYPPLAEAGVRIKYNHDYIQPPSQGDLDVSLEMDNSVVVLTLFPGISQHIVEAALNFNDVGVVIMRTYGSGNAMTDSWFTEMIREKIEGGLLIINITQCRAGGVTQGRYATSTSLSKAGVISGGDMVIEAAITKSMHLLGKGLSGKDFAQAFRSNTCGEITV